MRTLGRGFGRAVVLCGMLLLCAVLSNGTSRTFPAASAALADWTPATLWTAICALLADVALFAERMRRLLGLV